MKIQLKRSNVLDAGVAKSPTAGQMEYGELAVNYSTLDPVLFIKDSGNNIVRITDSANDGEINIEVGNGLAAAGDNATANQVGNTTRTLSVVADTGYGLSATATGIRIEGAWTNIPALPTV